jgi:ribonuclease P/MRP protein subunit RPP1
MGQTMLYDLNVAWSPSTTADQLLQLLTMSATLGYGTVALNHTLTSSPPQNHTAPFPDLSSSSSSEEQQQQRLPHILHRATLALADPGAFTFRLGTLAKVYDILAVRPATADAFQNACLTLDVSIISLDLTQRFPFHFRPKPCMAAVSRGVRFEICYGQAVGSVGRSVDARARAQFIANVTQLVRATRGRGILISSEARTALGLRPPADVVNLLNVWGLGTEQGMEGIRSIPRSIVVNEGLKRTGYKGVIDVVQAARGGPTAEDSKKATQTEQAGKKGKKQKRKNGEGAEQTQQDEARQNKKVKLVSRESKKGSD